MRNTTLRLFSILFLFVIIAAQPLSAQRESAPLHGEDRDLLVSPQTLLLDASKSLGIGMVTIHADVPYRSVVGGTVVLTVEGLGSVPAAYTFADDRGDLVAKFYWATLAELFEGEEGDSEIFTFAVTCDLEKGGTFEGEDDVRVIF